MLSGEILIHTLGSKEFSTIPAAINRSLKGKATPIIKPTLDAEVTFRKSRREKFWLIFVPLQPHGWLYEFDHKYRTDIGSSSLQNQWIHHRDQYSDLIKLQLS